MSSALRMLALVTGLALALAGCSCHPTCAEGAASCPCRAGACDDGLVCKADGTCAAGVEANVRITDPSARGCELVLTEPAGTAVTRVTFENGLEGAWVREAPQVAVTFVAGADQAIADGSIVVGLTSGTVSVSKASCVDLRGARLTGSPVEIP